MSEPTRGETFVMKGEGEAPKPIAFTTFILGLASTTLIHLGQAPDPESGASQVNLALARESLELLALLREKTKGNLTEEEEKLFDHALADLRLRYVEVSKR